MMAEGHFASLPRSLHAHRPLGGGSSAPSRRLQTSLASSMDLLSSKPQFPSGHQSFQSQLPAPAYHPVSIHGTLPRSKRGGALRPVAGTEKKVATAAGHAHLMMTSSLVQNIMADFSSYREPLGSTDCTLRYVTLSQSRSVSDGPAEKLHRELEAELKMSGEEPRSHAWYHGAIPRQVAENLVQRDGDFLIRDSLSSPGNYVLTCQWRNAAQHFKINKKVVLLNEAYSRVEFRLEREAFDSVPALVRFYVGNRKPVSQVVGAIIFQPINRKVPLRCLEERYQLSSNHREVGLMEQERRSQKRLSLNITNELDQTHDNRQSTSASQGGPLRSRDRCGSQPASLNQVPDRRCPLKAHQSESFLPLGSKSAPQWSMDAPPLGPKPKSPVFRTGSEPTLSPSIPRRPSEPLAAGQAIRGSDSQLCPKPPPKPSKVVPPHRSPLFLGLQPVAPPSGQASLSCPTPTTAPLDAAYEETPAVAPRTRAPPSVMFDSVRSPSAELFHDVEAKCADIQTNCGLPGWEELTNKSADGAEGQLSRCSYVERLRREGGVRTEEEEGQGKAEGPAGRKWLDRSSYHHAIAALENTSEEEEEDAEREGQDEGRGKHFKLLVETQSAFRPADFSSRLLPPENKPLETAVLRRAKELLLGHSPHSVARHLLLADCQVARVLGVSPKVRGQMGVASGLELVTLPHGQQLRLDLMERHHTMAVGVAVDILGCTGSVEERASTLNRIILVALELKDTVGDLFAFTALMKALELPQISRLEETWTTLRRKHTRNAITYEKILKPFYKNLHEGIASCAQPVCIPFLLPLLTLMERPSITPEGAELWETSDQGCDIMLRHLEAAREVAHHAQDYTVRAQSILQGFQCDDDLLEVFQTDFQLRLLWGSRGASVNQSDRYNKFNLILTALSRKLEATPTTQTLI